jgi:hypothetical protein
MYLSMMFGTSAASTGWSLRLFLDIETTTS